MKLVISHMYFNITLIINLILHYSININFNFSFAKDVKAHFKKILNLTIYTNLESPNQNIITKLKDN